MSIAQTVICLKDEWTTVVTGVVEATLYIGNDMPRYIQTIRPTGDPPPVNNEDAAPIFRTTHSEVVKNRSLIDIYVKALRYNGSVTVHY